MTMKITELKKLTSQGESETVEFKKSTSLLTACGEALCGFLNHRGGTVLIGVNQKQELIGQDVNDRTQQELANLIRKIEPAAPVEIHRVKLSKPRLEIIALRASESRQNRPFLFDGKPYQRIGTTTSIMPQSRYQELLLQKMHANDRWEITPDHDVQLSDLDSEEIARTARLGKEVRRLPETMTQNSSDILDRLGLRVKDKILRAAVILYGTQFLPFYPQCLLRLARFRGNTKTEFLDNRQVHGNAFKLLDEAMIFLERHLPVAGKIEGLERKDTLLFPIAALREALVNAICHRDYSIPGGAISLAIYDDRLEIWSTGKLPFGLQIDELKKDHASTPRNPTIAGVFYKRGLVESWGRGTQKIVELCLAADQPEPEFLEQAGSVGVRFLLTPVVGEEPVSHQLPPLQKELLEILSGESLSFQGIVKKLTLPPADRTIRDHLARLKELNMIGSRGRGKNSLWFSKKSKAD